jgi:hypothetical protein
MGISNGMGKITTREKSSRALYKHMPISDKERTIGEKIYVNYKKYGQEGYITLLRTNLRNLEVDKKWALYYSYLRCIKYAMAKLEEVNDQWPMALRC